MAGKLVDVRGGTGTQAPTLAEPWLDDGVVLSGDTRLKTLPFIMVTAESKTENVVAARAAGVNNYILKPFTAATLKQKIVAVMGDF